MAPSETNVLGAITIGVLIDIFLQGIATTQLYTYYSRFPKDLRLLKAVVSPQISCTLCLSVPLQN